MKYPYGMFWLAKYVYNMAVKTRFQIKLIGLNNKIRDEQFRSVLEIITLIVNTACACHIKTNIADFCSKIHFLSRKSDILNVNLQTTM